VTDTVDDDAYLRERQIRVESLFRQVVDELDECDIEVVHELKVRIAASKPMTACPPGVTEMWWTELRRLVGGPVMRKRLWSVLIDQEARRSR